MYGMELGKDRWLLVVGDTPFCIGKEHQVKALLKNFTSLKEVLK